MIETKVFGRATKVLTVDSWRGRMVEIRQKDVLSPESQVLIDKDLLLKIVELLKEDE